MIMPLCHSPCSLRMKAKFESKYSKQMIIIKDKKGKLELLNQPKNMFKKKLRNNMRQKCEKNDRILTHYLRVMTGNKETSRSYSVERIYKADPVTNWLLERTQHNVCVHGDKNSR